MKRKVLITFAVAVFGLGAIYIGFGEQIRSFIFKPTGSSIDQQKTSPDQLSQISIVAHNLDTPWAIAALPSGRIIITERSGIVSILGEDSTRIAIADVVEQGEGGLLGLTIHPDFEKNNRVYVYKTTGPNNVVESYRLDNNKLSDQKVILASIPAANAHNGGEIKFGPDKKLYITTGDATNESQAQDKSNLAGKILRVNDDGSTPSDNPFMNQVWSYGHRNPQGLAWDARDRLWSTEHGPSGAESGYDELNLIQKGGNYGWPQVRGDENGAGLVSPVVHSGVDETWAPAGLSFADGSLFFGGLRGQALYEAKINGDTVSLVRHFVGEYGRIRAVTVDDQVLLISTSNRDGRGSPSDQDDRIVRIPLAIFK